MLWILGLLAAYLLILWVALRIFVHPMRTPTYLSPGSLGLPQEDIEFVSGMGGVRLRGWIVPVREPRAVAILVHGYLMNRSEMVPIAWLLAQHGIASVLFDLRAHGKSGGGKTGMGFFEQWDVRAAVAEAERRFPGVPRVLIGSSMGAASCALAMAEEKGLARALVMDSAFSRLVNAITGWWILIGGKALAIVMAPSKLLARFVAGFDPRLIDVARALKRFEEPVLLLHGERDTLAPAADAHRNLVALGSRGTAVWFENRHHIEGRWMDVDRYNAALLAFIELHVVEKPLL